MLADHPRGKYSGLQGRAALCTGAAPARILAGCENLVVHCRPHPV